MSTETTGPVIVAKSDLVGDYVYEFKEEVLSAIETERNELVIDLSNVQILSSSAIGVLARAVNTLSPSNRAVVLRGVSPDILRVLNLMGVTPFFKIQS
ncbi:MAG: STAS domain-containing protein [Planctomycetia bacterium]|jgi:anti-anti-sigma factor